MALLRGVNVGGNNLIPMSGLRTLCERAGFRKVTTYIQSGNVLFESRLKNPATLSGVLEEALTTGFGCTSLVIIVPQHQLESVVLNAPPGFGAEPAQYRYDVAFLKPPLSAQEVFPTISLKPGVDGAWENNGVLYFNRLTEKASQSHLPKLIANTAYRSMTIRNWNTTSKLYRLMQEL